MLDETNTTAADALNTGGGYFQVNRDPYGGYRVKRVNQNLTTCADGTHKAECNVTGIDVSAAGLESRDIPVSAIYYGILRRPTNILVADEVWKAASATAPIGNFYKLSNNGNMCVTPPCFTIDQAGLNTNTTDSLSGIRGELAQAAQSALAAEPILAAGRNIIIPNAGPGKELKMSQYYTRIKTKRMRTETTRCSKNEDCTLSAYTHEIRSTSECYCNVCPKALMNVKTETRMRKSWEASCSRVRLACPGAPCEQPRPYACVNNTCTYSE